MPLLLESDLQEQPLAQAPPERLADEPRAPARLLEYRRGQFVAFAAHATVGLIERPQVVHVPGVPYYCLGLMEWEGRQLPLLDLNTLLRAASAHTPASEHVLVLAWQHPAGGPVEYGAVCAPHLVRMTEVADSQQCLLPQDGALWPSIAMSCFQHEGQTVPVLDTARVFAQPHGSPLS